MPANSAEAVAAIERAGGHAFYDGAFLGSSTRRSARWTAWKERLVDLLGIDYFESVQRIYSRTVPGTMFDDSTMAEVGKLRHLTSVVLLARSQVTDAGLAHVRGLRQLHRLALGPAMVQGQRPDAPGRVQWAR